MMVSDDKKAKATPAPKDPAPKDPAPKDPAPKKEDAAKSTPEAVPSKPEGADKAAAAPASYSRGEGQKAVTQAYKDNWNAIFATKTKQTKKPTRKTKTKTKNKKKQGKKR
jgi:hypothetical protein